MDTQVRSRTTSLTPFIVSLGVLVILLAFVKKQSDIIHDLKDKIENTQSEYVNKIKRLMDAFDKTKLELFKEIKNLKLEYIEEIKDLKRDLQTNKQAIHRIEEIIQISQKELLQREQRFTKEIGISLQNTSKELLEDIKMLDLNLYTSLGLAKCLPCSGKDPDCIPCNMTWRNCADVYKSGHTNSGVYRIKAGNLPDPVSVYCEASDGGGWTVFQRCEDGSVSFERNWQHYKQGFGNLKGSHWLGNEVVSAITTGPIKYTLRVDLMNFDNEKRYADYDSFEVRPETENYKLLIGAYSGTAGDNGDGLSAHNGAEFTTLDVDNDTFIDNANCAKIATGGWWYLDCHRAKLNGKFTDKRINSYHYMNWMAFERTFSLKYAQMKFRSTNF